MTSICNQQSFLSSRFDQSLCSDRCQNILYKSVFEHFTEIRQIATFLLASKSFQNSSFGANFLLNFMVDRDAILLFKNILSPSSCLSLQFAPSLHIGNSNQIIPLDGSDFAAFVAELVETKYLRLQLRSLGMKHAPVNVVKAVRSDLLPFPQLFELNLSGSTVDDSVMTLLAESAPNLTSALFVGSVGVTDLGIGCFYSISSIRVLHLQSCGMISDEGLEHISSLRNLTDLDVGACSAISDVGVDHISKCCNLTSLNLMWCPNITNSCLEYVSRLSSLVSLTLRGNENVTYEGFQHLINLPAIISLDVSHCGQIVERELQHIARCSTLTDVNLRWSTGITGASLLYLTQLHNLTHLDIRWCYFVGLVGSVTTFKEALPNCTIEC